MSWASVDEQEGQYDSFIMVNKCEVYSRKLFMYLKWIENVQLISSYSFVFVFNRLIIHKEGPFSVYCFCSLWDYVELNLLKPKGKSSSCHILQEEANINI